MAWKKINQKKYNNEERKKLLAEMDEKKKQ